MIFFVMLFVMFFMVFCTYLIIQTIVDEKGIYKLKSISAGIVLYDLNILFHANNCFSHLNLIECWLIIIGLILAYVYSFRVIMHVKDTMSKIVIVICWIMVSWLFCATALDMQLITLVYIFKAFSMFTLLVGLFALRDCPAFGQIIGAIIWYIIMIGTNTIFSIEVYGSLSRGDLGKEIYETVQRSYCLNPIDGQMFDEKMALNYIVDFFVCRIMDVIILGFLSARFLELVKVPNKKEANVQI